ncbi:hypothetical protein [Lentilactobacillus kosonis]|uniref:Uncharacterized protein n=1 Tax=Lentilactobacillus kosonis TaxID=2810561 RepID=A0A401FNF2_9LACO|nr:hypothetical protein [Lentilactobacillus kosonis]GAY73912.1 hypothetical protein NBRC111893_2058 [Lentilactobacillus kosonis]
MGFSPAQIFADICLIVSIGIGLIIQMNHLPDNVQVGLVILALIFFLVSISVSITLAVKSRRRRK